MTAQAVADESARGPVALLDRIERIAFHLEAAVVVVAMAVILVSIAVSVIVRFFDLPLPNFGEAALVAMSALTFVGGSLCSYVQGHISVDAVDHLDGSRLQRLARFVCAAAVIAFGCYFCVMAWGFFSYAWSSGERLIDLGTPMTVPGGFMLVGAGLLVLHGLADLLRVVAGFFGDRSQ